MKFASSIKRHTDISFLNSYHLISKTHTIMLLVLSLLTGLVSLQESLINLEN